MLLGVKHVTLQLGKYDVIGTLARKQPPHKTNHKLIVSLISRIISYHYISRHLCIPGIGKDRREYPYKIT